MKGFLHIWRFLGYVAYSIPPDHDFEEWECILCLRFVQTRRDFAYP